MTQRELNWEIAYQTGDSIQTIDAMGFSPLRSVIPIEERQEPFFNVDSRTGKPMVPTTLAARNLGTIVPNW